MRFAISVFPDAEELAISEAEHQQFNELRYGGYAAKQCIKFAVVTRCDAMKSKFISSHEKFAVNGKAAAFQLFVDAAKWVHT